MMLFKEKKYSRCKSQNFPLTHSIFPEKLNIFQVRTEFEFIYINQIRHCLNNSNRIVFKQKLMSLYERYVTIFFQQNGRHPSSFSQVQRNALQSLRDDSSVVISKPDKGNGVVIMNKSDYHSKMRHILNDKTKFSGFKSDNNLFNLSRFQRFLRRFKSKKLLEEDDYRHIYPSATSLPAMHGLYLKYISRLFHLDPSYRLPEVTIRSTRSDSHKTLLSFESIRRISKIYSPSSIISKISFYTTR